MASVGACGASLASSEEVAGIQLARLQASTMVRIIKRRQCLRCRGGEDEQWPAAGATVTQGAGLWNGELLRCGHATTGGSEATMAGACSSAAVQLTSATGTAIAAIGPGDAASSTAQQRCRSSRIRPGWA